jgi:hypothetical protein
MNIFDQIPPKAYKYMREHRLKELESTNSIFINYLNNYPETVHGSDIGDDFEGKSRSEISLNHDITPGSQTTKEKQILRSNGVYVDDTSSVKFSDVSLVKDYVDDNYFVYCVSLKKDTTIQKAFGSGLQTIFNFPEFIKIVTAELNQQGVVLHDAGECVYLPKRTEKYIFRDLTENQQEMLIKKPYLVKELSYEYQREFRIIWKYRDNKKIEKPVLLANLRRASFYYNTIILKPANQKKKKKKRAR